MKHTEVIIKSVNDVSIQSELISSGGGNYYRNKIRLHLQTDEDFTQVEAQSFATEIHYVGREWEIRLMRQGSTPAAKRAAEFSPQRLVFEEDVDMNLEDFDKINFRIPVAGGFTRVQFKIEDGKVHPLLSTNL